RCGGPAQQLGSKTVTSTPADSSTPASRQTPRGGARKVYSPQCGSYGPISSPLGESIPGKPLIPKARPALLDAPRRDRKFFETPTRRGASVPGRKCLGAAKLQAPAAPSTTHGSARDQSAWMARFSDTRRCPTVRGDRITVR